jgi:hypothetical protein
MNKRTNVGTCAVAAMGVAVLASWLFVRSRPLVFNESFWSHAHCILGAGQSLGIYAHDHEGRFPFHTNGYADALLVLDAGWDTALTGPGYTTAVFERMRKTGGDAPEAEFGRVYVQGLSETNAPDIAILFDKLATPGGDHCHGLTRLSRPLVREVWTIGGGKTVIAESDWKAYAVNQVTMLVAAGIPRETAQSYYDAEPLKR